MTEDKFDQKIKGSLSGDMVPSQELIDNAKQGVRKAHKLEKRWAIFIHFTWIVVLTVIIEQFIGHLNHTIPSIITIVIMMHIYIPVYVVMQSLLKKEYKLYERVR
ncbi:anti-sigma factor [Bacillus cereus]|nr:anti-sigma factor [Bacillus cereus]PFN75069.1 anti-sigma factor [Bacillus cereus]